MTLIIDRQICELRSRLERLQAIKRKANKGKMKTESLKRGRPEISPEKIAAAKELAKRFPIPDVALVTEISLTTLYRKGIKRYKLDAEARIAA